MGRAGVERKPSFADRSTHPSHSLARLNTPVWSGGAVARRRSTLSNRSALSINHTAKPTNNKGHDNHEVNYVFPLRSASSGRIESLVYCPYRRLIDVNFYGQRLKTWALVDFRQLLRLRRSASLCGWGEGSKCPHGVPKTTDTALTTSTLVVDETSIC